MQTPEGGSPPDRPQASGCAAPHRRQPPTLHAALGSQVGTQAPHCQVFNVSQPGGHKFQGAGSKEVSGQGLALAARGWPIPGTPAPHLATGGVWHGSLGKLQDTMGTVGPRSLPQWGQL